MKDSKVGRAQEVSGVEGRGGLTYRTLRRHCRDGEWAQGIECGSDERSSGGVPQVLYREVTGERQDQSVNHVFTVFWRIMVRHNHDARCCNIPSLVSDT